LNFAVFCVFFTSSSLGTFLGKFKFLCHSNFSFFASVSFLDDKFNKTLSVFQAVTLYFKKEHSLLRRGDLLSLMIIFDSFTQGDQFLSVNGFGGQSGIGRSFSASSTNVSAFLSLCNFLVGTEARSDGHRNFDDSSFFDQLSNAGIRIGCRNDDRAERVEPNFVLPHLHDFRGEQALLSEVDWHFWAKSRILP